MQDKLPWLSSSMVPNLVGHHSPSSPGDKETIVVSKLRGTRDGGSTNSGSSSRRRTDSSQTQGDLGDKYRVDGRKTLVVDCKMCGKDVASLCQHQAICANIHVPKQQGIFPTLHPPPPSSLPVEELTKKFLTIQDIILQLRAQLDDAPALQSALDLYQAMRANVLDKLNAVAQNHCIV
ncbi:hypothetical protein B5M09_004229 [Aphanomyces astaci]|uniref:Uncharacterized protein n=1 Tax=Aphanomyces astaci TaxID=112090 RepID=A0A425D2U1_APHAT|nr:hypothetical protein B5M09_004229 [Aphanomyces astaci]